MAAPINSDLIVSGILRLARQQAAPGDWLSERHQAALEAVMAGDKFCSSTAFQGTSHTAERNLPAATLLALYEAALQIWDAEQAAADSDLSAPGSVRHADFSQHPCTLG